ncbi:MAG: hypothetical protein P4M15_10945 [Alphaproteobacteria bacterium]|nr:hypothetical protein [Alphaproteobacteria bacterium]
MTSFFNQGAFWFRDNNGGSLFYPFGISNAGYHVPDKQRATIMAWAFWRIQLHIITWTLIFVPLIVFWAPSLAVSQKLELEPLALAVAAVTALTLAISWVGDRLVYAVLLKSCARIERSPLRSERRASSGQIGVTRNNLRCVLFPTSPVCLAAGLTTILFGINHGDRLMTATGAILSLIFAWPVMTGCKNYLQGRIAP